MPDAPDRTNPDNYQSDGEQHPGLGPVLRNTAANQNRFTPKPHLAARLTEHLSRGLTQGPDGKLVYRSPDYTYDEKGQPTALSARQNILTPLTPAITSEKLAFDPMTEPLQVGDRVEVVFADNCLSFGKQGVITIVKGRNHHAVRYDDGRGETWGLRSSLKLLEKAPG